MTPYTDPSKAWRNFKDQVTLTETFWSSAGGAADEQFCLRQDAVLAHSAHVHEDNDVIFWTFGADEVLSGHIGKTMDRLLDLVEGGSRLNAQGKVVFQFETTANTLNQYDAYTARVSFVTQVSAHWNYWLHFMAADERNRHLLLAILSHQVHKGRVVRAPAHGNPLWVAMGKMHRSMAILHAAMGMNTEYTQTIYDNIVSTLRIER